MTRGFRTELTLSRLGRSHQGIGTPSCIRGGEHSGWVTRLPFHALSFAVCRDTISEPRMTRRIYHEMPGIAIAPSCYSTRLLVAVGFFRQALAGVVERRIAAARIQSLCACARLGAAIRTILAEHKIPHPMLDGPEDNALKKLHFFLLLATMLCSVQVWAGPRFQLLHAFAGPSSDGSYPATPLLVGSNGNLLGATTFGGDSSTLCYSLGCGIVFELAPRNGHWNEALLYNFSPTATGSYPNPQGPLTLDASGNIYGIETAGSGDSTCGCGAVFQLTRSEGAWTLNILHTYTGPSNDGSFPNSGLISDNAGNLYGATPNGGFDNSGTVFELTPNVDGTWTYNIIYSFGSARAGDGEEPSGPLTIDASGNLYGTTTAGGNFGEGTVYKLAPSGGAWTESILFNFSLDYGTQPNPTGVQIDSGGNLYGTTSYGGPYGLGTIYKLTPTIGLWNRTVLHSFTGGADGAFPFGGIVFGPASNLYGAAYEGGTFGYGNVYEFSLVNGKWKQSILHQFTNGNDGSNPYVPLVINQLGNLYGAADQGGAYGFGTA